MKARSLSGNHDLLLKLEKNRPKIQLMIDPKILPRDAAINNNKISESPAKAIFNNKTSEAVGNNVAETKAAEKMLK